MKKLISAVLALTLLGTAAASAQPYRGNYGGHDRFYHNSYRGDYRAHEGVGLIGLGVGILALAAIASSQNQPAYGYQPGYDGYNGR